VVESIDFSFWLSWIVRPGDKVRLKMDIEGAEYEVLPKMLEDGTIQLVDELIIEWHDFKVGVEKRVTKLLRDRIRRAGVRILKWK